MQVSQPDHRRQKADRHLQRRGILCDPFEYPLSSLRVLPGSPDQRAGRRFVAQGLTRRLTCRYYINNSRYMDNENALLAFAALGQPTRLDVFRLLIKAGGKGMSAGEIGVALDVRAHELERRVALALQVLCRAEGQRNPPRCRHRPRVEPDLSRRSGEVNHARPA